MQEQILLENAMMMVHGGQQMTVVVLNDAIPTLIVSFIVNVSSSIAEAVAANVSLDAIILINGYAQYIQWCHYVSFRLQI